MIGKGQYTICTKRRLKWKIKKSTKIKVCLHKLNVREVSRVRKSQILGTLTKTDYTSLN